MMLHLQQQTQYTQSPVPNPLRPLLHPFPYAPVLAAPALPYSKEPHMHLQFMSLSNTEHPCVNPPPVRPRTCRMASTAS